MVPMFTNSFNVQNRILMIKCLQIFYASQNIELLFPYTTLRFVTFNGEEVSVLQSGYRVLMYYVFVFRLQRINKGLS